MSVKGRAAVLLVASLPVRRNDETTPAADTAVNRPIRDENLLEAVDMARASSKPALVLVASLKLHTLDEHDDEIAAEGSSAAAITKALTSGSRVAAMGAAAVAVIAVVGIFVARGKR